MPMISTDKLCFTYEETNEKSPPSLQLALKDVTLDIEAGSFVAILGHNGSGKSTLAKHFNAILLPHSGRVLVDGIDTREEDRLFDVRRKAGMVFQNPDNQIVATMVEEDVAFACENIGLPQAEIRRRVDDSLAVVGMSQFANHAPHLLSGGQKQRVAIAGVLAMEPQALVMDEPTAMLDPSGRREVLAAVHRLNREQGMTILLITHHMDEAAQADRVIVMKDGAVVMDGTPRQVFSQVERVRALSLDVPQSVDILNALGQTQSLEALTVEECAQALYRYLTEEEGEGQ